MGLRDSRLFSNVLKLVPSQFSQEEECKKNILLNFSNKPVFITFEYCDICFGKFIGIEHINPKYNPVELALSYCGCN